MSEEPKIVITNRRPTLLYLSTGVKLLPGPNTVSLREFEANRNVQTFRNWQKIGWISVKMPKSVEVPQAQPQPHETVDTPDVETLAELNAAQAISLVQMEDNLELLDVWKKREERVTVIKAIDSRLAELTERSPDDNDDPQE